MLPTLEEMMQDSARSESEIAEIIGGLDPALDNLPNLFDELSILILSSYRLRRKYIEQFGFIYLSINFKEEIKKVFSNIKIDEFIELGAGVGSLLKVLSDVGLVGTGITLEIPEDSKHWGMSQTQIYKYSVKQGLLNIGDMQTIFIEDPQKINLYVASWVPLEGGQEHIQFLKNNYVNRGLPLPTWHLNINEEGGCTGDDTYWAYINEHYEVFYHFKEYRPFSGLYDRAVLYKSKSIN